MFQETVQYFPERCDCVTIFYFQFELNTLFGLRVYKPSYLYLLSYVLSCSQDVYEFLQEIDGQDSRRKSEPIKSVSGSNKSVSNISNGSECRKEALRKNQHEETEHIKELQEEKTRNLETLTKYKSEISR